MKSKLSGAVLVVAVFGTLFISPTVGWASPDEFFKDCGTIIQGVECWLFDSDHRGVYGVQNYGNFGVGDTVLVTGVILPECASICMQGDTCIHDNTIEDCSNQPFEDCGVIVEGVECWLFDSDNFGLYEVQNFGSFGVGDRVLVNGVIPYECYTFCMQGDGCIRDNTIEACSSDIPTLTEWGMIIFCTLLFSWMAWVIVRRRKQFA